MQKLKQIISDLATDLKAIHLDDRLSNRFLISKFRDKVQNFLRQDARSRELLKDNTVWKSITCIALEDVDPIGCGCGPKCNILKRTTVKIPEAYNTNYGQLIKVLLVDFTKEFSPIQRNAYADYANREYSKVIRVYWVENGYIYIPNLDIDNITVLILAKDPLQVDKLNGLVSECTSPLEADINYPDYLITLAKKEVLTELAGEKPIVSDEKGDDNTNRKQ